MAPFVELEWGAKAYDLMWDLKRVFDPDFVLNPGVLLNRDPDAHRKFLKPSPVASEIIDRYPAFLNNSFCLADTDPCGSYSCACMRFRPSHTTHRFTVA